MYASKSRFPGKSDLQQMVIIVIRVGAAQYNVKQDKTSRLELNDIGFENEKSLIDIFTRFQSKRF